MGVESKDETRGSERDGQDAFQKMVDISSREESLPRCLEDI